MQYKKVYVMDKDEKKQQDRGEIYACIIMLAAILKFII